MNACDHTSIMTKACHLNLDSIYCFKSRVTAACGVIRYCYFILARETSLTAFINKSAKTLQII